MNQPVLRLLDKDTMDKQRALDAALGQIEMYVLLVIAIRPGPEDCCKSRADAGANFCPQIFGDVDVGQTNFAPVGQSKPAHIDRIGPAVLA